MIISGTDLIASTRNISWAESGQTFYLKRGGGITITLPTPLLGLKYSFVQFTTQTTDYTIGTNGGANILHGSRLQLDGLSNIIGDDTITFVAGDSVFGDRVDMECDGSNWHCKIITRFNGGITTSAT
jgi:hypothetical protein